MAYHIYTTEGIILKRSAFGEADVLVHVLTYELGLIMGSARSARLSVSKLRPALQEYAYVSVSCIKGKNGWKITNVVEKSNFFYENPKFTHKVMAQVVFMLLKMIPGESPNKEIFQTVKTGFDKLKSLSIDKISDFEALIMLRMLNELGYVEKNSETESFLKNNEVWDDLALEETKNKKTTIISIINHALKESHL